MKQSNTTKAEGRRAGGARFLTTALLMLVAAVSLLTAGTAQAQYRTSIQGVVTDTSGGVIPGAVLTLTNTATNGKQERRSDANGVYNFNALPADVFVLTIEKKGFQKQVLDQLTLSPEQANSVNVQLSIGTDAQTVTVNASTEPAIDTETANNGRTITANEIQHLPAYQRDVTQLIQLAPGVQADGAQAGGGGGTSPPAPRREPHRAAVAI